MDDRMAIVKQVAFYALLALTSYLVRAHFDTLPDIEERLDRLESHHVADPALR